MQLVGLAGMCLTLGAFVPGCGVSEEGLCDAECDCEGCSDADFDRCVNDYDGDYNRADRNGCPDLYDDFVSCRSDTYFCDGADFEDSCKVERERLKNCID